MNSKNKIDPIWPRHEIARLISDIVNELYFVDDCGEYVIKELEREGLKIERQA